MNKKYNIYDTASNKVLYQISIPDDLDPETQIQPGQHYELANAITTMQTAGTSLTSLLPYGQLNIG